MCPSAKHSHATAAIISLPSDTTPLPWFWVSVKCALVSGPLPWNYSHVSWSWSSHPLLCPTLSDIVQHWKDSDYLAVYHRGRYFRLGMYNAGTLLSPREIEFQIQKILDDSSPPSTGEDKLGALTAGDRWVKGWHTDCRRQSLEIYIWRANIRTCWHSTQTEGKSYEFLLK